MTDRARPLLLLDVDGPLNPHAAPLDRRPDGYTTHRLRPTGWADRRPLRVWLRPDHGASLLACVAELGCELVWCTTWNDDANRLVGPVIGLPELPVVDVGDPHRDPTWKFGAVERYAGSRPLAWLDDDFGGVHRAQTEAFLERRAAVRTLLVHVDPAVGLRSDDLDVVAAWWRTAPLLGDDRDVPESPGPVG